MLNDEFFNSIKDFEKAPKLDENFLTLRKILNEIIRKVNVHKFDGK